MAEGDQYLSDGDTELAIESYRQALLECDPDEIYQRREAYIHLALGRSAIGEYETAENNFRSALELSVSSLIKAEVLFLRAEMREARGWFWAAYLDLDECLEALSTTSQNSEKTRKLENGAATMRPRLKDSMVELADSWPVLKSIYY